MRFKISSILLKFLLSKEKFSPLNNNYWLLCVSCVIFLQKISINSPFYQITIYDKFVCILIKHMADFIWSFLFVYKLYVMSCCQYFVKIKYQITLLEFNLLSFEGFFQFCLSLFNYSS